MKNFKQFEITETSKVTGGQMKFGQQAQATFSVVINIVEDAKESETLSGFVMRASSSSVQIMDMIDNWKDNMISGRDY